MKIAITLVHNKSDAENAAQIESMFSLVTEQTELIDGTDDEGNVIIGAFERHFYTLNDLGIPHEIEFFHVIPFQPKNLSDPYIAVLPSNLSLLKGRNVQYGKGDEDKIGDHPRFYNWGLKRATDYGAEAVIHMEDYKKFSVADLAFQLNTLIDPNDKTEFLEDKAVKITTLDLLKEVGQLDEAKSKEQAIIDLKQRNIEKGGKNG